LLSVIIEVLTRLIDVLPFRLVSSHPPAVGIELLVVDFVSTTPVSKAANEPILMGLNEYLDK